MKKILSSLLLLTVLIMPALALAADPNIGDRPPEVSDLSALITAILNVMWVVFVVIAVVMFVVAGILFVSSQGSPEKVATARQSFIWGIVGVVVAIIAFSIIAIVESFL